MYKTQALFCKQLLVSSFFLCITIFPLKAQVVITLEAALDSTLKNNLEITQAKLQSALNSQNVTQSKMDLLPTLSSGVSGRVNGGSFFDEKTGILGNTINTSADGYLNSSITLFQGFQRVNQIAYTKYILEADKSYANQVRNGLQLAVFTTYMEALTNRDLWNAAMQQLKLSQEQFLVEEIHVDAGNKTLSDLSQARSQVALDELNVTSAQNAYELSILTLKQLMEMDPQGDIALESPEMINVDKMNSEYNAKKVYENAVLWFPEVKRMEFNTFAAKQSEKIAKGGYYPSLSLSSGLSSGYTNSYRNTTGIIFPFREQLRNNFSQYIGMTLNVPVFNSFRARIGVKKAKIQVEMNKVIEMQTKNTLNKVINQAVLDFQSAQKRYAFAEQAYAAMKETFFVMKEYYEIGLVNSIELSIAQTNMNKAEFDFIAAKYTIVFRNKVIDYYLGKPFHL
jgi:outer membrane protein